MIKLTRNAGNRYSYALLKGELLSTMLFDDSPEVDAAQVEAALERIRPALISDGGNIELVAIEANGDIRVRLKGACVGCPSSTITCVS